MRPILALLLTLGVSGCANAVSYKALNEQTGAIISPDGGVCSATTVGPHAIATTKHCLKDGQIELRYQGVMYRIERVMTDGNEGLLVRLYGDLAPIAEVGPPVAAGDVAWLVGNPAGIPQALREARVSLVTRFRGEPVMLLDCRCWHGDSGAGIFDDHGKLVGIYYGSVVASEEFQYPFAYPLSFTADQWKAARL